MPTDLLEGVKTAVKGVACAGATGSDWLAQLLADRVPTLEGIQSTTDRFKTAVCGDDPSTIVPVSSPPPFTGGQCYIPYLVDYSYTRLNPNNGSPTVINSVQTYNGPISGIEIRTIPGPGVPLPNTTWQVWLIRAFDEVLLFATNFNNSSQGALEDAVINSVTPTTPGADVCGDLPGDLPAPISDYSEDVDVEYEDPDGNPVTLPDNPLTFYPPCIGFDGASVPFEIDLGFTKICGRLGLVLTAGGFVPAVDFTECPDQKSALGLDVPQLPDYFDLDPPVGGGTGIIPPDLDGSLSPPIPEGTAPIQGVFVAANRNISAPISQSQIPQFSKEDSPPLLIPRIGTVRFEYLIPLESGSDSQYSKDIPIKAAAQFIPCEWEHGAVAVTVNWEYGWDGVYVAARRKSCCDACSSPPDLENLPPLDRCKAA